MWREFRESAGFVIAALIGLGAATLYFATNIPEPTGRRSLGASADGGGSVIGRRRANRWTEWRTDDFFALVATLDRSDPSSVVRQAFEAQRERKYERALAFGTDSRQRRFTPASMAEQFDQNPGLSGWETLELAPPVRSGRRAAVALRSRVRESEDYTARALLRVDDTGAWMLEVILPNDAPERSVRESEGAFAARCTLPPLNVFNQGVDRATARGVVEEALHLCRAGESAFASGLFAPRLRDALTMDGFGRWLEMRHPWLHRADAARTLETDESGEYTRIVAAVSRPEGSRRFRFWCARVAEEPAPSEFIDGEPVSARRSGRRPSPSWEIARIDDLGE